MSRNSDSLLRKEVECDLGFASGNEVRQRLRRTAGQGPAERAVTGIEKQLGQPRAADDRHVVRRRRPQARPPLHYRYSAETGKQLPDPPHDRIATDRVDGSVVASELRGPRGAQAVAEARDHDLVRLVGQADLGRRLRLRRIERQGNRVALERIDGDFQSQASQQQWAVTSQGDHIGIGEEALAALQPDRVGLRLDRLDHRAVAECDTALRTAPGELLRKAMRSPHSHCAQSARGRNSSGASSRPSQRNSLGITAGLAQGSACPAETWPPLANEVSIPASAWRSSTVTSCLACARYHALVTPITPAPRTMIFTAL